MKIFKKITSKNYWISIFLIAMSIMIFNGIVAGLLRNWTGITTGLVLDFLALVIVLTIARLIWEEILEISV